MAKSYYGTCYRCKQYGVVTFRSTKSVVNEETGEKTRGKVLIFCPECIGSK